MLYTYVCFDVEDLVHPDSDDIPAHIADVLAEDGIVASMFVVGEKARLWEQRGRWDVIAAVKQHDIGLHTDHHSVHPVVCEYLADKGWQDGVAEAQRQEGQGARDLARIFGQFPSTWATGGSSWGPQIPAATRTLGIPSNVYSHAIVGESGASWFAGQLCFYGEVPIPGGEDAYCDDEVFEANLPFLLQEIEKYQRKGAACLPLFGGHPTRLRYEKFWDGLNFTKGKNTPPEEYRFAPRRTDDQYQTSLRNLRRMILTVRDLPGIEIVPVRWLNLRFGVESGPVTWADIGRLAQRVMDSRDILTDDPLASPAQVVDILARAVLRLGRHGGPKPRYLPLRLVLGPTELPPVLGNPITVDFKQALAVAAELVDHVGRTSQLPASVGGGRAAIGPGPTLRTLAEMFLRMEAGVPPEQVTFHPGAEEPRVAQILVEEQVYQRIPGWPPHADDLNLDQIALHTRLQSWSLKPAVLQE